MTGTQWCPRCEKDKPKGSFKGGKYCKPCQANYNRGKRRPGSKKLTGRKQKCRVCERCNQPRPTTSFRARAKICRRCQKESGAHAIASPIHHASVLQESRVTYEEWVARIGATTSERRLIHRALKRYGKGGPPTVMDMISEYCGPEHYVFGGPGRRSGQLAHAVVLLASEMGVGKRRDKQPNHEAQTSA